MYSDISSRRNCLGLSNISFRNSLRQFSLADARRTHKQEDSPRPHRITEWKRHHAKPFRNHCNSIFLPDHILIHHAFHLKKASRFILEYLLDRNPVLSATDWAMSSFFITASLRSPRTCASLIRAHVLSNTCIASRGTDCHRCCSTGQRHNCPNLIIRHFNVVMLKELFPHAFQNGYRLFVCGLRNIHPAETSRERRILFDVLSKLSVRSSSNQPQLSPRKSRLNQVGCIKRSACCPAPMSVCISSTNRMIFPFGGSDSFDDRF